VSQNDFTESRSGTPFLVKISKKINNPTALSDWRRELFDVTQKEGHV
jgi:hypothetical protein